MFNYLMVAWSAPQKYAELVKRYGPAANGDPVTLKLYFPNGGTIWVVSFEQYEKARGRSFDRVWIDERINPNHPCKELKLYERPPGV